MAPELKRSCALLIERGYADVTELNRANDADDEIPDGAMLWYKPTDDRLVLVYDGQPYWGEGIVIRSHTELLDYNP